MLVAGDVAAIVVLHRLASVPGLRVDWAAPGHWLAVTAPADAVVAMLRVAALGVGYWLLVTTLAYVATRLTRRAKLAAVVGRLTVPAVRRVTDRALAVTLATSTVVGMAGPVGAQTPVADRTPVVTTSEDRLFPPGVRPPTATGTAASSPAGRPTPHPTSSTPGTTWGGVADEQRPPAPREPADSVVVERGDSLWRIAAEQLAARDGVDAEDLSSARVAAYWMDVVTANRDRLRSGDPDLIYPGERIVLPDEAR